ncbi:cyclin-dependent protein kinase [Tulasnella sp. JGI-2019a]|nr:cyclin-dependent protein kinase [Tulasnella sp. JGI-2019a]
MNLPVDTMRLYRSQRDSARIPVTNKYSILGFISSGTYGRVYKARSLDEESKLYAIKKFKPDKEGEVITYTGISQSACREIALNREIKHENVISLREVMLEDKSIYMVFEYAEHDFLQVIHHHATGLIRSVPVAVLKSLMFQLLNGVHYLHSSHILHRDLKPANILITSKGVVKIGDLGLARLVQNPLQPLFIGDKVVVTIWYRAPELLMGARHYTKAIDCWALGCILGEMLSLRPMFKGEEAKLDSKKNVPFQRDQVVKIVEVLGTPDATKWPGLQSMPEYQNMTRVERYKPALNNWCRGKSLSAAGVDFLSLFLEYNPITRMTAKDGLNHKWFQEEPIPTANAFATVLPTNSYPLRRVSNDEATAMLAPTASRAPTANSTYNNIPRFTGMTGVATGMQMGSGIPGGSAETIPARKRPRLE